MKIVCDTNVLVSGLLFGGPCRRLLRLVSEGRVEGFISQAALHELDEVLQRPKFALLASQVSAIVELVRETFRTVSPTETVDVVVEDADDNAILEAAIAAAADVVVSGDRHLLAVGRYRQIRILSPARFLEDFGHSGASS